MNIFENQGCENCGHRQTKKLPKAVCVYAEALRELCAKSGYKEMWVPTFYMGKAQYVESDKEKKPNE